MQENNHLSTIKFIFSAISQYKMVKLFEKLPNDLSYYDVIKNPFSISDIREKVQEDRYSSIDEFQNDFEILYSNTQLFNGDKSLDTDTSKIIYLMISEMTQNIFTISDDISKSSNLLDGLIPNIDFAPAEQLQKVIDLLKN